MSKDAIKTIHSGFNSIFVVLSIYITNIENLYSNFMHLILCREKIYRGKSDDVDCSGEYPHSSMANAT